MLTPALIMCTSVPTFFFLVFIFFGERWCNEGGEASWLHLSLGFLDVTSPHPLSLSLYPESNISLHELLLLLLGNSWPRSRIHANSLRLVGSILSCYGRVVKLTGVSEKNRFWPKKKNVSAAEGFCFHEGFLLRYPSLRGPFANAHSLGSSGQP